MTVELITGTGGCEHVGSEDFGAYQAATYGSGVYILRGCSVEVIDANTIRVKDGELLVQGRHVRVKGQEDISIQNGATGRNRKDLIVVRYTKDASGVEDAPLVAIPGTPTSGTASDPPYVSGSILDGDLQVDVPIWRVSLAGLSAPAVECLVPRRGSMVEELAAKSDTGHKHSAADVTGGTLPIARGGTGATTAAAAFRAITGYDNALGTANTGSTDVPALSGSALQRRSIPVQYNSGYWNEANVAVSTGTVKVWRRGGLVLVSIASAEPYGPYQSDTVNIGTIPSGYRPPVAVKNDGLAVYPDGSLFLETADYKNKYALVAYALA